MRSYWALVKRELGGVFYSWTGYVVVAGVLFLMGLSFASLVDLLNNQATEQPLTEVFYGTAYFWFILLLVPPVMTMRSFAAEKSSGTFETLMTTPVRDVQVVLAKFTGALVFYIVAWLPLLVCLWLVRRYCNDPVVLEVRTIASTYLGIILLGAVFMSMGCFASSLTRNQIIAAMISLAMGISLFLLSFISGAMASGGGWRSALFEYLGLVDQMEDFASGIIDTRPVVLYASLTSLFLFMTLKVVESRRWK